jgi:gluconolactonase
VVDGRRLENGRLFVTITPGFPDGLKADMDGRVYSSSFSGVQIFSPEGELLEEIVLPGAVNFAFAENTLLITTDTAIWAAQLSAKGA